jgi:ATP-dependent RNA helicase DeaD
MHASEFAALLGPELCAAIEKKGYTKLTPVQEAVLAPALSERDLRISSQTGSGKTLAIGFSLRHLLTPGAKGALGVALPRALVVTPTRELAKQVETELSWLYASSKIRVACVTGGANYRDEHRSLAAAPGIVVGTPGRLLDHLKRGSVDPRELKAIVLDEADRMLDLGFREDLDAILAMAPAGHRTHLVSATFSREVLALADRAQKNAAHVQGTPLGTANADIEHVMHLVAPRERVDALVNLLLADPDAQTLIFARTRADVARVSDELHDAGFKVGSLSGEMEQAARNRALSAFKRGDLLALVATDVAARGIDVQDIARVVQLEPPTDPDSYTHRSGRTGRAGRKGMSLILVPPSALSRTSMLLKRAGVKFRTEPIPTAEAIRSAREQRLLNELTADEAGDAESERQWQSLAERIAGEGHAVRALARLLARVRGPAGAEPRTITPVAAGTQKKGIARDARAFDEASPARSRGARSFDEPPAMRPRAAASAPRSGKADGPGRWEAFRVSWGETHGADARRLVAMLCRRGGVRGADIGAIRVADRFSVVEIAASVAQEFEQATREPDPRDPRVFIERERATARAASGPGANPGGGDHPSGERPARAAGPRPSGGARPSGGTHSTSGGAHSAGGGARASGGGRPSGGRPSGGPHASSGARPSGGAHASGGARPGGKARPGGAARSNEGARKPSRPVVRSISSSR